MPLLLLTCLIAAGLYWFSVANANRAFDRALLGASLAISDRVVVDGDELLVDLPYVALEMLSATAEERVYYRVSDRVGQPVTGYEQLPEPSKRPWLDSREDTEWFYDTEYLQQSVRVAVISRVALGGSEPTRFLVYVAETDNGRKALALRLLLVFGLGMALSARIQKQSYDVVALLSDGECNEGSIWEAAMMAAAQKVDNLMVIIDFNKWQATGRSEEILALTPLVDKWSAFGWDACEIDGHDMEQLINVLTKEKNSEGKPIAVIAHTVKGKGVSFMEDDNNWHYRIPSEEELVSALKELGLVK